MEGQINEIYYKCPYKEGKCVVFESNNEPIGDKPGDLKMISCSCPCAKYQAYLDVQDPDKVKATLNTFNIQSSDEPWLIMMTMQKKFASRFHKVENLTKNEIDHWINEYLVCIEDETREVREHLNFYTGNETAEKNVIELQKEIIDILHFVMDEFIVGDFDITKLRNYYLQMYTPNILDVKDILKFAFDYQRMYDELEIIEDMEYKIFILINKLLDCSSKVRQQISWKHWKKPLDEINYDLLYIAFIETFKILVDLFITVGMTSEDVKNIYIKKNIENIYRQNYHY